MPSTPAAVITDHLSIIGIAFVADARIPGASNFARTDGEPGFRILGAMDDLLIEDCLVRGYHDNILFQNFFGDIDITNVKIRRSMILDSYAIDNSHAQGLYAEGVQGLLLEENVFDHNGWMDGVQGAYATGFNHNVYMRSDDTGVVVRGNIFARAASHGLQARGGGVIENNLFLDNPIGHELRPRQRIAGHRRRRERQRLQQRLHRRRTRQGSAKACSAAGALEIGNTKKGANVTVDHNVFAATARARFPRSSSASAKTSTTKRRPSASTI